MEKKHRFLLSPVRRGTRSTPEVSACRSVVLLAVEGEGGCGGGGGGGGVVLMESSCLCLAFVCSSHWKDCPETTTFYLFYLFFCFFKRETGFVVQVTGRTVSKKHNFCFFLKRNVKKKEIETTFQIRTDSSRSHQAYKPSSLTIGPNRPSAHSEMNTLVT